MSCLFLCHESSQHRLFVGTERESRIGDTKREITQNILCLALECAQGHSVTWALGSPLVPGLGTPSGSLTHLTERKRPWCHGLTRPGQARIVSDKSLCAPKAFS